MDQIIVTVFMLVAGIVMLVAYKKSGKPVRNGMVAMGSGVTALVGASFLGLGVPLNAYTLVTSVVLGIPGVASLAVINAML